MTFKDFLKQKKITGYALSKNTGISYTTISDLINGKTNLQNISLKHAIRIASFLKIDIHDLANMDTMDLVDFRYFRNNLLHELKHNNPIDFINKIIKQKEIDFYYKNNGKEYAYYLLALIDYLSNINNIDIYQERYNDLRKERLDTPLFVGSDLLRFNSVDEAEEAIGIKAIPEFKKYNIIEEDIYNVA